MTNSHNLINTPTFIAPWQHAHIWCSIFSWIGTLVKEGEMAFINVIVCKQLVNSRQDGTHLVVNCICEIFATFTCGNLKKADNYHIAGVFVSIFASFRLIFKFSKLKPFNIYVVRNVWLNWLSAVHEIGFREKVFLLIHGIWTLRIINSTVYATGMVIVRTCLQFMAIKIIYFAPCMCLFRDKQTRPRTQSE